MHQFFVDSNQITDKTITILGKDVNHIKHVLRLKEGEEIAVNNGQDGREYRCEIREICEQEVICTLRFIKEEKVELPVRVTLFQGLPKSDKMELIIQKMVELGVYEIVPVATKRAVVKLDEKKATAKVARWQSISEAAAKQSKRGIVPKVLDVVSFDEAVRLAESMERRWIPYEMAEGMEHTREQIRAIQKEERIAIFIGPEGGFSEEEIAKAEAHGIRPITLGKRILRTETAGLTVMAWIMYQMEE